MQTNLYLLIQTE